MAKNLASCSWDTIYIHDGVTSTVLLSFGAPGGSYSAQGANGLAFDDVNGNLISVNSWSDTLYIHDGISSTVSTSFSHVDWFGLTFDGANLICIKFTPPGGDNRFHIHDGVTSTIVTTVSVPGNYARGITFDGTNLIYCDTERTPGKIYILDDKSSTVIGSFSSPDTSPEGLAFDGTNLISCDDYSGKVYIHDGISSTVTSQFSATRHGLTMVPVEKPTASNLKCEGQTNPANVTDKTPEFSAVYKHVYGYASAYYRIQVARDINFTDIVWDSGKKGLEGFGNGDTVSLGECEVSLPLDGTKYYWRVKFWDSEGNEGDWSSE